MRLTANKIISSALVGLALAGCTSQTAKESTFTYQNPIMSLRLRDTHIVPDGGRYYAVGTCEPVWGGQNPGVKLFVSDNLLDWQFDRMLIDAEKLDPEVWYKDRFWAPELHKIGGRYLLTFNCQNNSGDYGDTAAQKHYHACGIAASDSITGPYTVMTPDEPLTPFASNDMTLFQDDDSRVYCFFNNGWTNIHRIYVAELDTVGFRLKEQPVELIHQEPGQWDGAGIEGSHVVKHNGVYYLFYSSWSNGYAVGYATATDIRGPWTKYEHNPLFGSVLRNDTVYITREGVTQAAPDCRIHATGHNQIFTGPDGRLWTSYHGNIKGEGEAVTMIDPIWFEEGRVKTTAPTYTEQSVTIKK